MEPISPTIAELQSLPSDDCLAAVANAVGPGSLVVSSRRLPGGLSNGMHVIELKHPDGQRQHVVLRRFSHDEGAPAVTAVREWRVLQLLREAGIPAPEPILLDENGEISGSPAIVISLLDGRPLLRPPQVPDWARQVAMALWTLHSGQVDTFAFLGPTKAIKEIAASHCEDIGRLAGHPLGERIRAAMLEAIPRALPVAPRLTHGDFWPGNILWRDDRILALVDWTGIELRDPAMDVGYMWMDLILTGEPSSADDFVDEYERLNGGPVTNLRLATLLALSRAAPDPALWLPGWVELGRTDLTVEDVRRNFTSAILRPTEQPPPARG